MNLVTLALPLLLAQTTPFDPSLATPARPIEQIESSVEVQEAASADDREMKSVLRTSGVSEAQPRATTESPLTPIHAPHAKGTAGEVLATSLIAPKEASIAGRPFSLLDTLVRSGDRSQQLWSTRAYWKLTVALADYNLAADEQQRMEQLVAHDRPIDQLFLQTAKAAAGARVRETEIAALAAQHELAELMRLPVGEPLPVTADVPHVGSYRTYFETLFAVRTPPARARLIDRTLPTRRELIEARATAVQAAEATVEAVTSAYGQGGAEMRAVLSAHETLWRERRNFLAAVRDYNFDIAEYALAIAQVGTSEVVLVSMLIKSPQPTPAGDRREPTPAVRPASGEEEAATAEPGRLDWTPAEALPATEEPQPATIESAPTAADPFAPSRGADRSILKNPATEPARTAVATEPNPAQPAEAQPSAASPAETFEPVPARTAPRVSPLR